MTATLIFADNTRVEYEVPEPVPPVVKYPHVPQPRVTPPSFHELYNLRPADVAIKTTLLYRDPRSTITAPVYKENCDWIYKG